MKIKSPIIFIIMCLIFLISSCERSNIFTKIEEVFNIKSTCSITEYKFLNSINPALSTDVVSIINENAKTITLTVPYNTDVTGLIATYTTTGEIVEVNTFIQESGFTSNNFTNSVIYTVIAEDDSTFANYNVTVNIAPSDAKAFTQFDFLASKNLSLSADVTGVIDENSKTILLCLPYDADTASLIASFAITGKQVEINSAIQDSGVTSNNFSSPVTYTVVADDNTTVNYTATVEVQLSPEKAITSFMFSKSINTILAEDVIATIDENNKTIDFDVSNGTDVSALIATFTTTGTQVKVNSTIQISSETANDFTSSVLFTVTAEDSSSVSYVATANVLMSGDNFDDPNLTGWTDGSNDSEAIMVSPGANGSAYCLYQSAPSSIAHYSGIYKIFSSFQAAYVSYYVKFTSTSLAHGYATASDAAGNRIFFIYGSSGTFGTNTGQRTSMEINRWYFVEIKNINFSTKTYDFYIDGTLFASSVQFMSTAATELTRIDFYNYQAAEAYWDELIVE